LCSDPRACKLVSGGTLSAPTTMPHPRGRWEPGRAGPILMAASSSHSPRRRPVHPGWFQAAALPMGRPLPVVGEVSARSFGLLSSGGEARPGGQLTGFDVAPQRDQQLARQSDDHDGADASFGAAGARGKPLGERALRLEAQPAPGKLHDDAADAGIAVLADPLLALHAAAAKQRAGEAGETGDRPAVAE